MFAFVSLKRAVSWLKSVRTSKSELSQATIFAPTASTYFKTGDIACAGGAERQLFNLAEMLSEAGVDIRVLTINVDDNQIVDRSHLHVINTWRSDEPKLKFFWGLARHISSAPSPVYVRTPSPVSALVSLGCRAMGKRVALSIASDLNCIPHSGATIRNFWTKVALKTSSQVVAQTQEQQKLLMTNFKVSATLFPNVIRNEDFSWARASSFHDRDIDVAWIGGFGQRKGLEDVVEIAGRLNNCKFAVLGGSLPGERTYADKLISWLRGLANVTVPGFVQPIDIPSWPGRSKILLHTSPPVINNLTKEGFPNVFLEAWAAGVTVVSLHADPDQLLSYTKLGYKCSSITEAVTNIEKLVQDEQSWEATHELADTYIKSWDIRADAVREAFVAILLGRRGKPAIRMIDVQVPDECDISTENGQMQ